MRFKSNVVENEKEMRVMGEMKVTCGSMIYVFLIIISIDKDNLLQVSMFLVDLGRDFLF